jgi:alpha-L-fucosidase
MKRRSLLQHLVAAIPTLAWGRHLFAAAPAEIGPFSANWRSLEGYRTPEWFRNAKFGIWAHWGPQCEPEFGDWYAREMYMERSAAYRYHLKKYGHPSVFGFKDVIREWRADQWDPHALVGLYKNAGARYFVALANHHDNFDLYHSRHQPQWNATQIGPKRDLIEGWHDAARAHGLRFGVSVHAAHAWNWFETSQRSDKEGICAGIPYDGKMTMSDGVGTWWEGMDPQALYAQNHATSRNSADNNTIHGQWNWSNGAVLPSKDYCEKFYDRTVDLIDSYDPDLVYFDDTVLPLWPVSDVGLRIAAHMYNRSIARRGSLEAVINGKILDQQQRQCMVWDIERGQSNEIEPLPWQTCTCIGNWHYDRRIHDEKRYKSARTVVHTLVDVVSKNGNLLLNIPVRGNGAIDEQERAVVEEIGRWMAVNGDGIYDSRPWRVFGEGPAMELAAPLSAQGFNEGKGRPYTPQDIRFTAVSGAIYAYVMGWPDNGKVLIKSMRTESPHLSGDILKVELLGGQGSLHFTRSLQGLQIALPAARPELPYAFALRISWAEHRMPV